MAQAKKGDTVKVHYTGKLDDGTVFDSSQAREPLQFKIGEKKIIPGFEEVVVGMNPDESKTIKVPADKAYGPHRKEMVTQVDRNQLPPDLELKVGQHLQNRNPDGQMTVFQVTDVSGTKVTLDANHPLAGKDLTFDIQLVEIV